MRQPAKDMKVGSIFPTKRNGSITIIRYVTAKEVHVRFQDTGYTTTTGVVEIRKGVVKDYYLPSVYKVGYIGKGPYPTTGIGRNNNTCYIKWRGMLSRCYNPKDSNYPNYGAKGITVVPEWHCYQSFAGWCLRHYTEGYVLDKDLLHIAGPKVYGPFTCSFITAAENIAERNRRYTKKK